MKKNLIATLLAFCLAIVFTVTVAGGIANAQCANIIHATGGGGDIECRYSGADTNYCYYNCTCTGRSRACEDLYDEWGLEAY